MGRHRRYDKHDDDDDQDDGDDNDYFHDRYSEYWQYTPAAPRSVKGGIKAKSSSGGFARKWWGRRWIQVLEGFHIGARLSRGRSYARRGQVMNLEIGFGSIQAEVQGTRSTPYRISITLQAFDSADWDRIVQRLSEEPGLVAQLLRNEMPEELESLFNTMKLPLFPGHHGDLKTGCSCPDWSNPCKHIAAAYYLLAEALDDHPFLLLRLRGMEMDDFMNRLRGTAGDEVDGTEFHEETAPLPLDHGEFWRTKHPGIEFDTGLLPPAEHAQLPLRLGALPFWRSDRRLQEEMGRIYEAVSAEAMEVLEPDLPDETV